MVVSKNKDPLIDVIIKDLESTSSRVNELIKEIQEADVNFVEVKTELRILIENFKELSAVIRDGDGKFSLLTRVALVEQGLKDLEKWIDDYEEDTTLKESTAENGKWQMRAAILTGILALITSVVTLIIDLTR